MKENRVSYRYAKSLLNFSIEQKKLEDTFADMETILKAIDGSKDLDLLLKSPVVKSDKKQSIIDAIFGDVLGDISKEFVRIIVRKGREQYLGMIAQAFVKQYKEHKNITTAEVVTAIPLDETLRNKVLDMIKKSPEITGDVELVERVDKEVIGGLLVRVGDRQNDATIARRLNELKQEFYHNPYVAEF